MQLISLIKLEIFPNTHLTIAALGTGTTPARQLVGKEAVNVAIALVE